MIKEHEKDFGKEAEHKLKYTAIHKEFVATFEKKLEDFIISKGVTLQEFQSMCAKATDLGDPNMAAFIEVLLMSLDYLTFIEIAKDEKKRKYFYQIMDQYRKEINSRTGKK